MIAAVLNSLVVLCDLNIIQNITETCIGVEDDNATRNGASTLPTDDPLSHESWPVRARNIADIFAGP